MLKKIVLSYYYCFYKFFKFWEYVSTPKFWSDWKAGISLMALEIWFLLSILVYYSVITKDAKILTITNPIIFIPFILILLLKYYCFIYSNKWREYIKHFDGLEKRKNIICSWIVLLLTLLIISNLIYSFYLMNQIDWSSHR